MKNEVLPDWEVKGMTELGVGSGDSQGPQLSPLPFLHSLPRVHLAREREGRLFWCLFRRRDHLGNHTLKESQENTGQL